MITRRSRPDGDARPRRTSPPRDEDLIRTLYQEHGRSLLAYATRLTGNRESAEDVVQETLIRAWKHADAMHEGKGSVRGWLLTVARNIAIDQARARASRPVEVAQTPDAVPVAGDHAQGVVNMVVVLDALEKLSLDHRAILVELYYHRRSTAETAARLGIPPGTVKSRSYYALRAMHAVMSADTETGGRRDSA